MRTNKDEMITELAWIARNNDGKIAEFAESCHRFLKKNGYLTEKQMNVIADMSARTEHKLKALKMFGLPSNVVSIKDPSL